MHLLQTHNAPRKWNWALCHKFERERDGWHHRLDNQERRKDLCLAPLQTLWTKEWKQHYFWPCSSHLNHQLHPIVAQKAQPLCVRDIVASCSAWLNLRCGRLVVAAFFLSQISISTFPQLNWAWGKGKGQKFFETEGKPNNILLLIRTRIRIEKEKKKLDFSSRRSKEKGKIYFGLTEKC